MKHARHGRHGKPKGTRHIGSKALEQKVDKEYLGKGYSRSRARHISGAVAGKVYREQKARKRRGF